MQPMRTIFLLFLVVFGSTTETRADDPGSVIPPDLILQRFAVNEGGDALLVPVTISGKNRLFLVDTGCATTIIEESLLLGDPQQVVLRQTGESEVKFKEYRAPEGSFGQTPLGLNRILGMNLKSFREVSGYAIEGILGMDFMGRYVVRVDFDRGELYLLRSVPKNSGQVVPIRWSPGEWPSVEAWISPEQKVKFLSDTGRIGRNSGELESSLLEKNEDFKKVGSTLMETASGTHTFLEYRGRLVALGGFSVSKPIFCESPSISLLGTGFWSRFVVTFDFPNQNLYLQKGREYSRPDLRDLSGLHLLRRNGKVIVHSVDKGRPSDSAGIKKEDEILTLGTMRASEMTMFEIRKAFSQAGSLKCSVRRGSEEHIMFLSLPR